MSARYMFSHLRSRDVLASHELQVTIARNINPRVIAEREVSPGRMRSARFAISPPVSPPPAVPRAPAVPPPPEPPPQPPPEPPSPVRVIPPPHYGGNVLQFHFQSLTPGGGGNNEIRVSPRLDYPHVETKSLLIVPYGNVQAGQFIQIFVSPDDDIANTATPSGSNFSGVIGRLGDNPGSDNTRAIPVPSEPTFFDAFRMGWTSGGYVKVRLFFVAPATALPVVSVIIPIAYRFGDEPGWFAIRS